MGKTPKTQATEADQTRLHQAQKLLHGKRNHGARRHPTEWEKIPGRYLPGKGAVIRIHRQLKNLSIEKTNPVKKWARGPSSRFSREETEVANKHAKKMLNITVHQGHAHQNHNGLSYHLCQNDCYQKKKGTNAGEGVGKGTHTLLVGMQVSSASMENSMEILLQTRNRLAV